MTFMSTGARSEAALALEINRERPGKRILAKPPNQINLNSLPHGKIAT
jgi:hypothetical protein